MHQSLKKAIKNSTASVFKKNQSGTFSHFVMQHGFFSNKLSKVKTLNHKILYFITSETRKLFNKENKCPATCECSVQLIITPIYEDNRIRFKNYMRKEAIVCPIRLPTVFFFFPELTFLAQNLY